VYTGEMIAGITVAFVLGFLVGRSSGIQDGIHKVRKRLDEDGIDLSDHGF
jgi:hypothetical protein